MRGHKVQLSSIRQICLSVISNLLAGEEEGRRGLVCLCVRCFIFPLARYASSGILFGRRSGITKEQDHSI